MRSTLLALNAGVPKSLVDMMVVLWDADGIISNYFNRYLRKLKLLCPVTVKVACTFED